MKFRRELKYVTSNVDKLLICLFLVCTISTLFIQVVARILNYSFSWTQEFSCFNFVWLIFLGVPLVYKEKEHIVISYIYNKLTKPVRVFFFYINRLIILAIVLILIKPAFLYGLYGLNIKSAALLLPMIFVDISVFVSLVLLFYQIIKDIIKGYQERV